MKNKLSILFLLFSFSALNGVISYDELCKALGINQEALQNCSQESLEREFQKAYFKFARTNHPDKNPENKAAAEALFKEVRGAYDELKKWNFKPYNPNQSIFTEEDQKEFESKALKLGLGLFSLNAFFKVITPVGSLSLLNHLFNDLYVNQAITFINTHDYELRPLLSSSPSTRQVKKYIEQKCPLYTDSKKWKLLFMSLKADSASQWFSILFNRIEVVMTPFKTSPESPISYTLKPFAHWQDCVETAEMFGHPDAFKFHRVQLVKNVLIQLLINTGTLYWLHGKFSTFFADFLIENQNKIAAIMNEFYGDNDVIKAHSSLKQLFDKDSFVTWKSYIISYLLKLYF